MADEPKWGEDDIVLRCAGCDKYVNLIMYADDPSRAAWYLSNQGWTLTLIKTFAVVLKGWFGADVEEKKVRQAWCPSCAGQSVFDLAKRQKEKK